MMLFDQKLLQNPEIQAIRVGAEEIVEKNILEFHSFTLENG